MAPALSKKIDVTPANGFCEGHFEGHPIVPAAVQVNWAMNLIAEQDAPQGNGWELLRAKFLRELKPNCSVEVKAKAVKNKWHAQVCGAEGVYADMHFTRHG